MEITRFEDASPYEAPGHFYMRGLRLQGFDVTSSKFAWTGLSHFLPGGGAEMDVSPLEKIYVVIDGEVTITLGSGERQMLSRLDSCFIPGGEERAILNESNHMATMLVIMPYPEAS
jgi:quercetin dioxygenase-like cupin family protein